MPRIGLLSDSHGRAAITHRAVEVLMNQGAQVLVHLGDVESPAVIDALAVGAPAAQTGGEDAKAGGVQVEAHLVFGNVDFDVAGLSRYARDLGITVDHPVGRLGPLSPNGGELVFCHGHDAQAMRAAIEQEARYLCHGHTHQARDTRQGSTRIINPGALHRARQHTVALLCTETDTVTFYSVT